MLRLIPASLHRTGYRIAHELRRRWWRISGAQLLGCRVLAFNREGHLLMVRHSYGSGRWMLPGGGVGSKESPTDAAVREFTEETGCRLLDPLLVALQEEPLYGTTNSVHVIGGRFIGQPRCDNREVIEIGLFDPAALPADLPPTLQRDLPGWIAAFVPQLEAERA